MIIYENAVFVLHTCKGRSGYDESALGKQERSPLLSGKANVLNVFPEGELVPTFRDSIIQLCGHEIGAIKPVVQRVREYHIRLSFFKSIHREGDIIRECQGDDQLGLPFLS
jgi:hypothetical protein